MKAGPPFRRSAPKCSGRLPSPCFLFVDIDVVLFFSSGWSLGRVRGEGRFPQGPAPMRADDRRVDDPGRVPRPPGRSRRWAGPGPGAHPDAAHGWRQNRPDPLRKARSRLILPHSGGPCRPRAPSPLAFRAFPNRTALRRSLAASPSRRAGHERHAARASGRVAFSGVAGGRPLHRPAGWFSAWCKSAENRRKTTHFCGKIPLDATICAVRPA